MCICYYESKLPNQIFSLILLFCASYLEILKSFPPFLWGDGFLRDKNASQVLNLNLNLILQDSGLPHMEAHELLGQQVEGLIFVSLLSGRDRCKDPESDFNSTCGIIRIDAQPFCNYDSY